MVPTYLKYFLLNAFHFAVFFWQKVLQTIRKTFTTTFIALQAETVSTAVREISLEDF